MQHVLEDFIPEKEAREVTQLFESVAEGTGNEAAYAMVSSRNRRIHIQAI